MGYSELLWVTCSRAPPPSEFLCNVYCKFALFQLKTISLFPILTNPCKESLFRFPVGPCMYLKATIRSPWNLHFSEQSSTTLSACFHSPFWSSLTMLSPGLAQKGGPRFRSSIPGEVSCNDLSKAFNTVSHNTTIRKLWKCGQMSGQNCSIKLANSILWVTDSFIFFWKQNICISLAVLRELVSFKLNTRKYKHPLMD